MKYNYIQTQFPSFSYNSLLIHVLYTKVIYMSNGDSRIRLSADVKE